MTVSITPSGRCAIVRFKKQQHEFSDFYLAYDAWYFRDEGVTSADFLYMIPVELLDRATKLGGVVPEPRVEPEIDTTPTRSAMLREAVQQSLFE